MLIDEFENDDENLIDEIIDDKCDNEVITHVFSQLKKEYVDVAIKRYRSMIAIKSLDVTKIAKMIVSRND